MDEIKLQSIQKRNKPSKKNLITQAQLNDEKIQKLHAEYKIKIKGVKQQIEQQSYINQVLTSKITTLTLQIQKLKQDNLGLRDMVAEQKRKLQASLYQMKLSFSQQKSILRQHVMQLQPQLMRTQKQLSDSLRRQTQFMANMRKIEESQQVKKSLRQVERRQLEKINRLLLLQK